MKRVTVRGDITVFRGTFKFDNFHFNYHIEANLLNFSPFSRFKLGIPGVHYSVHPNVDLSTVITKSVNLTHIHVNIKKICYSYTDKIAVGLIARSPIPQSSITIPTQCIYSLSKVRVYIRMVPHWQFSGQ